MTHYILWNLGELRVNWSFIFTLFNLLALTQLEKAWPKIKESAPVAAAQSSSALSTWSKIQIMKTEMIENIKNLDFFKKKSCHIIGQQELCAQNCACMASVLCLSIHTLEIYTGKKLYMVNRMHSFLNYIWISDRKSSVPISPSPYSTRTPLYSQLRVLHIYG